MRLIWTSPQKSLARIYLRDTKSLLASKKGGQPARKGNMQRKDEKKKQDTAKKKYR